MFVLVYNLFNIFNFNLDTINIELNGCNKSLNNLEIESTNLDHIKNQLTSEVSTSDVKLLKENIEECSIIDNINCNELCTEDEYEEPNNTFNSRQNMEINNYQNNNTNNNCDIICTNGENSTKIPHKEEHLTKSSAKNATDTDKCKKEVALFCNNLKSELEHLNYILNDESTIKHVAHLEIEASKKKGLENIVADFESLRISSPNPFLFVTELKTFIRDFDFNNLIK